MPAQVVATKLATDHAHDGSLTLTSAVRVFRRVFLFFLFMVLSFKTEKAGAL